MVNCEGLPSTCYSQDLRPLADQLRLDQDKLCLTPEVRSFHSFIMSHEMNRSSQLNLSDEQINSV